MAPKGLAQVLRGIHRSTDPNLLVGSETSDDAGVYRLAPDLALVQTVDFFPPVVDDPYEFGRVAAANALSDVYAMNGRPLTVLNLVGFPDNELPLEILADILRGAEERVRTAGAVTVGGHSVRDAEIKFGLSVTGLVDPAALWTNASAQPGDILVLTKPLGTGFVNTAAKRLTCPDHVLAAAILSMTTLNESARDAAREAGGIHAATDVTGFGLAGHASELADGSHTTILIHSTALPVIAGSEILANPQFHTRASRTNREFLEGRVLIQPSADPLRLEYVFDPQTSGGLLLSIAPNHLDTLLAALERRNTPAAAVVGRVLPRQDDIALVVE